MFGVYDLIIVSGFSHEASYQILCRIKSNRVLNNFRVHFYQKKLVIFWQNLKFREICAKLITLARILKNRATKLARLVLALPSRVLTRLCQVHGKLNQAFYSKHRFEPPRHGKEVEFIIDQGKTRGIAHIVLPGRCSLHPCKKIQCKN